MPNTVQDQNWWSNRRVLLNQQLVTSPQLVALKDDFWSSSDPVGWVVSHGYAQSAEDFYPTLSKFLKLPYWQDIPQPINPTTGKLPLLKLELMAKHTIFQTYHQGKYYLILANPFITTEMMDHFQSFLPEPAQVVIAAHGTIKTALTFATAYASAQEVESQLAFARPDLSCKTNLSRRQLATVGVISLAIISAAIVWPALMAGLFITVNTIYFALNPFKMALFFTGKRTDLEVRISPKEIEEIEASTLPKYTILIPLKEETSVLPRLINRIRSLDYPIDKLDIKFAVEVKDKVTLNELKKFKVGTEFAHLAIPENIFFHLVTVPCDSQISTKPRSCNFALKLAEGVITVIYDAEDDPDPLQLKKAWLLLLRSKLNTICVQARLSFYNARQNFLTRFFELEYAFWFESFLPGLQALKIPLPLGGTSNHFLTQTLRRVGGWDAHNVTEDADLGWRLTRYKYQTMVMNSYTKEEAMSNLWGWIKQRTRWQKGFILTFLVHGVSIKSLIKDLGWWQALSSIIMFGSVVFMPLVNPLLWLLFLTWLLLQLTTNIQVLGLVPEWAMIVGIINLAIGNGSYILQHLLEAMRRPQRDLVWVAILMPFYWPLLSISAYRAFWQIIINPYKWEKSDHGLHL